MDEPDLRQLIAQADVHCRAGRFPEAAALYEQVLERNSGHGYAHIKLGEIALATRQFGAAEYHLAWVLARDPTNFNAANNLAIVYENMNQRNRSLPLLRQLVHRAPKVPEAWFNLGVALFNSGDYEGAIECYESAIKLRPDFPEVYINLAHAERQTLRVDRAMSHLLRGMGSAPTPEICSTYILLSMFNPEISGTQAADLAGLWSARFATSGPPSIPFQQTRDPERPLRIGYLAPSFCNHPAGLLIEPVIERHDRARWQVFCYSGVEAPDQITERFSKMDLVYRPILGVSDHAVAQMVRDDQIDILVDLNLHMKGARLDVFALKPAPLQINYLAYPFTGGLNTFDYRVTDAFLDPPGAERFGPEAILRLRGCYWLYRPDADVPEPASTLPAREFKYFTFGNLNMPPKLNAGVAAAWARILNQVPNARLLQHSINPLWQRPFLDRIFGPAGLNPKRVERIGTEPHADHLARYRHIDLCLDPFPYGGHTSTLDALWMGVPVLTLAGQAPYTRGAASILPRVGLEELVKHSIDDYVQTAIDLASNLDRLEALRKGLRERMRQSILCDEAAWVADYERGLRLAWRRYCEGLPPAEIDLNGD